jgi:hypothetical protein
VYKSVRWVAATPGDGDLLTKLRSAGYSERLRTFFVWEGAYYLRESGIRSVLKFVRTHSAPGSVIAFDYMDESNPGINQSVGLPRTGSVSRSCSGSPKAMRVPSFGRRASRLCPISVMTNFMTVMPAGPTAVPVCHVAVGRQLSQASVLQECRLGRSDS